MITNWLRTHLDSQIKHYHNIATSHTEKINSSRVTLKTDFILASDSVLSIGEVYAGFFSYGNDENANVKICMNRCSEQQ